MAAPRSVAPLPTVAAAPDEPTAFSVRFGFGRADITASTMQILWEAGHTAAAAGTGTVRIVGYADSRGSAAVNRRLSLRRAEAVAAQLVKIGLAGSRMVVEGRGSIKDGNNAADDRRVEISFSSGAAMVPPAPVAETAAPVSVAPVTAALASPAPSAVPLSASEDEADDGAMDESDGANDPLEPFNRRIFQFNQALDNSLIKPAAEGYRDAVPEFARDRLHDLLDNLGAPLRFANDIAQGDIDRAVETFVRFTFNTGFGIGGLFDLAGDTGVPAHQTDTGATLGVWGFGEGPYLVLPILGPSNPRDAVGMAVDFEFDPVSYRLDQLDGYRWVSFTRTAMSGLDLRERNIDTLNEVERSSIDYYAAMRSLYRQHREAQIHHHPELDRLSPPSGHAADHG